MFILIQADLGLVTASIKSDDNVGPTYCVPIKFYNTHDFGVTKTSSTELAENLQLANCVTKRDGSLKIDPHLNYYSALTCCLCFQTLSD